MLDYNPAKHGVSNPQRRPKEKRPFESWAQIEAIAARLGPVYGPMVIFGAATGLRPSELFGLEQHDVDRELGVVYVRRAFANGRIKNTKTRLSTRAVPLQAKAVEALDSLPASVNPILFSNARGGRIDFRVFGRRHWRPALLAQLVEHLHGKEGVNGSSPLEGFRKFLLISSFRCRQRRRERASASTERPRAGESLSDEASDRCC